MGIDCANPKPSLGLMCDCPLCRDMRAKWGEGSLPTDKPYPKARLADMIQDFGLALQSVARVTAMGCEKHGPLGGWRNVPDFRREYQNKKARHAIAGIVDEGGLDEESGLPHLAHEAWNALALLQDLLEAEERSRGQAG